MQRFYDTQKVMELLFDDGDDDTPSLSDGYPVYNVYNVSLDILTVAYCMHRDCIDPCYTSFKKMQLCYSIQQKNVLYRTKCKCKCNHT